MQSNDRTPGFADLHQAFGVGHFSQAVSLLNGLHNTKISDRKDIRSRKPENQNHIRRPAANALDFRQLRDHVIVGERCERVCLQRTVEDATR